MTKSNSKKFNEIFKEYENKKTCIITGQVLNKESKKGVSGAIIKIFKKEKNNLEILKNITYSNQYGHFVLEEDGLGEYIIKINSLGYENQEQAIVFKEFKEIIIENVLVNPKHYKDSTKIVGTVKDKDNKPINLADVILCNISKEGELIPVAFQKTNKHGKYEFINVPKGKYNVKVNDVNKKFK